MKQISFLSSIVFILILSACDPVNPNEAIDEGKVEGQTFTSKEIGWSIEIPEGWEVISREEMQQHDEKGKEVLGEVQDSIDYSGLKHLISFQKDQFNVFVSTTEPFEIEYEGEWEQSNANVKDLVTNAIINQGIKVDTASADITIDGLPFEVFHIIMYSPDGAKLVYQDMYSRHINGFDFGVVITYTNEQDKAVMMEAWTNSTFSR